jgi:23S rRNA pseudouridine1911/1915/1917 synthase
MDQQALDKPRLMPKVGLAALAKMPIELLYIDNHLLALNKPAGLPTQVSRDHSVALETLACQWVKATYAKPGNVFLQPVHRLDRPVSGVVLFARTSKALARLNAAQRQRNASIRKVYWALVHGVPPAEGTWQDCLFHDDFHARVVPEGTSGAKRARLGFRRRAMSGEMSLVEVRLQTGRYHQIRVQFASRGWPVVGDGRYGSPLGFEAGAIALHQVRLVVPHPVGARIVEITAPLPGAGHWDGFRHLRPEMSDPRAPDA